MKLYTRILQVSWLTCWLALAPLGSQAATTPTHSSRPAGVNWFEGTVPEAFALAASQNKPVFLYWSAVWCPPCQELKATIFKRRDVLDRLSLFVPVYLDGDSAGAQSWGEHFHVAGYPTVVVLRGDQTEIERVNGGMDLTRYAQVLDLALEEAHAKDDVLRTLNLAATASSAALNLHDCRQLAYNAWEEEESWNKSDDLTRLSQRLSDAARRCPASAKLEITRLQLVAVEAAAKANAALVAAGKAATADLLDGLPVVAGIVSNPAQALDVGDVLEAMPGTYFVAAKRADPAGFAKLQARWNAVYDQLASDARYSAADHLYALYSKLSAAKAVDPNGHVPTALAAATRKRINAELAREHEPYARASLVNAALNILALLDDDARAAEILQQEIQTAANPFYYMPDLADIEEKRGHTVSALKLYTDSFVTAKGPATRFQWGVNYVRALVRLTPQDDKTIVEAATAVLTELNAAGGIHGRNRRSVERLDNSLRDWNTHAAHGESLAKIRALMLATCPAATDADAYQRCQGFLAEPLKTAGVTPVPSK